MKKTKNKSITLIGVEEKDVVINTYEERFKEALRWTLGSAPKNDKLITDWISGTGDPEKLQSYVLQFDIPDWMTGIAILEACVALADTPREGLGEDVCDYETYYKAQKRLQGYVKVNCFGITFELHHDDGHWITYDGSGNIFQTKIEPKIEPIEDLINEPLYAKYLGDFWNYEYYEGDRAVRVFNGDEE